MSARLNLGHPLLSGADEDAVGAIGAWEEHAWHPDAFRAPGAGYGGGEESSGAGLGEGSDSDDTRRHAMFALVRSRYSALPSPLEPLRLVPSDDSPEARVATDQVRALLEMLICGTTAQLMGVLQATLYLGPLRSIPSRGFLYARPGRRSSWADGLGAWDALLADSTMLLETTNKWLERLGAGCTVVLQRLRVIDAANDGGTSISPSPSRSRSRADARSASSDVTVVPSARRLLLKTANGALVLPSELGAGVSQLLPVVVAAATSEARLCMLEQPELHVHPALQVGLGDLFMQAVAEARGRRAFVIETHSEHLILRVLKRIRQTTDGELPEGVQSFDRKQLSVIYVDSVDGEVLIRRLEVDAQGEFVDRWPRGFFAERMEELL